MKSHSRFIQVFLFAALVFALVVGVTACSGTEDAPIDPAPAGDTTTDPFEAAPDDPAKQVVDTKCSMCHTLDRVYSADKSADEWVSTVDRMKVNGLVISDDEYNTIVGYLSGQ